jgi:hypothetical protein
MPYFFLENEIITSKLLGKIKIKYFIYLEEVKIAVASKI